MTINDWVQSATSRLQAAGIDSARLDSLILLEDVLNTNRTQILASPDLILTEVNLAKLEKLIQKRKQHIPLAYIRLKCEFYGRTFMVNNCVLVPRPESEAIIEVLGSLSLPPGFSIADMGSGSGVLGITAALELPELRVSLLEISTEALAVSRHNAALHNVEVQFIQSDLLANTDEQFDVLLCNLPYVPRDFNINKAAKHEPALALFGGEDGLDLYRRLFEHLTHRSKRPSYLITESLKQQHQVLALLAADNGYSLSSTEDLVQLFVTS